MDEAKAQHESMRQDLSRLEARRRSIEHDMPRPRSARPSAAVVSERYVQRGEYVALGAAVCTWSTPSISRRASGAARARAEPARRHGDHGARGGGTEQRATVTRGGAGRRRALTPVRAAPGAARWLALVGTPIEVALPNHSRPTRSRSRASAGDAAGPHLRGAVLKDNTARAGGGHAGLAQDALVAVRGALAAGDRIVVRGAERLEPGRRSRSSRATAG
jgi:hypothetical protein